MTSRTLKEIETEIQRLKQQILDMGPMRPGALSTQYREPKLKKKPFFQISYTHKGKSKSEYVRKENVDAVRREIDTYKRFRAIVEHIATLSIQASRLRHKPNRASGKVTR